MKTHIAGFITKYCRLLSVLTLLSLVIPLMQFPKVSVHNSVEMWLSPDQPAFNSYKKFLNRYGSEQFIVLASRWDDPLADEALDLQVGLARDIQRIPSVQSVFDFGTIARHVEASQVSMQEVLRAGGQLFQAKDTIESEASESPASSATPSAPKSVLSGSVLENVSDLYMAMHSLGVSFNDFRVAADNVSNACVVFGDEIERYFNAVTKEYSGSYTIPSFLYCACRELAYSYVELSNEFSRLNIDDYARFVGINRPDWRTFMRTEPLFKNFIIGPDGHTVGMIITIDNKLPITETVEAVNNAIGNSGISQNNVFLAGTPLINIEFDRGSKLVSIRFLPVAIGIGTIALIVIIRNIVGCIAITVTLVSSMIWTIGLLIMSGRSMNMVTITLPALLICLALAGNIHIVTHYFYLMTSGVKSYDALKRTVSTMLFPVFMTSLTTAVGFASVMVSVIRPIQDFGLFAAIGIMISGLFNFILLPGILSFNQVIPRSEQFSSQHWTHRFIVLFSLRRLVFFTAVILFGFGLFFAVKVKANSDTVSFLPSDSKVTKDYYAIMNNLTGLYSIEVDIESTGANRENTLKAIHTIAAKLDENPLVAKVLYPGQFKSFISRLGLPAIVSFYSDPNKDKFLGMLKRFQAKDYTSNHWRLTIFSRAQGSAGCQELQSQIQDELKVLDSIAEYSVTGLVPLLNESQNAIVHTQIRSFSIAVVVIMLLIGIFMRSFKALLAAIVPNALPIVTLFAFMAVCGINLDVATVMIAGIATGIAADDTIHFLACYQTLRPRHSSSKSALIAVYDQTGRSITWTSIIAACGFSILLLAPFKPLQYFGLLGSVTMLTAWLCDIIVLPACINLLNLWEPTGK